MESEDGGEAGERIGVMEGYFTKEYRQESKGTV
jgi:hypothetical protein